MPIRLLSAIVAVALSAQTPARPIFRFSTDDFWLNLHHFLYVLGRAEAKMADASRAAVAGAPADSERGLAALTPDERQIWRDAIAFYAAGPSRKDAVFDDSLSAITSATADAGDRAEPPAGAPIDAALRSTLERAAPVYRKSWWTAHREANVGRRDDIQALVDRHGAAVLAYITRAYGMAWRSEGYPVHLSGWANWAGAYSTNGNLLVMSSLDRATLGYGGLEIAFHEGMHQWDRQMNDLLFAEVRKQGRRLPANASHAMIFFTAGDAVRRVSPDHVPYADANGIWQSGFQRFKAPLDEVWKPYLDGTGTRDEAISAFVARVAVDR